MRTPFTQGVIAALGIPGLGIFGNMVGFAAIAREAGFDISMSLATTVLVWGMPGQVAMASLHIAGSSLLVIFTGVALANLRMLFMTISAVDILGLNHGERKTGLLKQILLMQMVAITAWAQIGMVQNKYNKEQLYDYFIAFGITIYISGLTGTVVGYYISEFVNEHVLRAILVITPLYILMMVINAGKVLNRIAGFAGGALCPLLYPWLGEWSVLIGGIAAGTAVAVAAKARRKESGT